MEGNGPEDASRVKLTGMNDKTGSFFSNDTMYLQDDLSTTSCNPKIQTLRSPILCRLEVWTAGATVPLSWVTDSESRQSLK